MTSSGHLPDPGIEPASLMYLPDPRIEPASLMSPALGGKFFTTDATCEDLIQGASM